MKGGLVVGTLAGVLPSLAHINAVQAGTKGRAKKIVYIWGCGGGPANVDFCDPKEHSSMVDQLFPPIPSTMRGVRMTDQFPNLAGLAEHLTLFRARYNFLLDHESAIASSLQRDPITGKNMLTTLASNTPAKHYLYAEAPNVINGSNYRMNSFSVPLAIESYWSKWRNTYLPPDFAKPDKRIKEKWALRQELSQLSDHPLTSPQIDQMEEHQEEAVRLVRQSSERAMQLDPKDVARYSNGKTPIPTTIGPLLARDLIQKNVAGAVLIRMGYSSVYGGWDQHTEAEEGTKEMAPPFDHAVSELIRDYLNGMLPDTIIVYDTEFGRTPQLRGTGRDHFPWHSSFILSDQLNKRVWGRTNREGEGIPEISEDSYSNDEFAEIVTEAASSEPDFRKRGAYPEEMFTKTR